MWQEIGQLIKKIDLEVVIFDVDMYMYFVDQKVFGNYLYVFGKVVVVFFVSVWLFGLVGKWVGGGGDWCKIVFVCFSGDSFVE